MATVNRPTETISTNNVSAISGPTIGSSARKARDFLSMNKFTVYSARSGTDQASAVPKPNAPSANSPYRPAHIATASDRIPSLSKYANASPKLNRQTPYARVAIETCTGRQIAVQDRRQRTDAAAEHHSKRQYHDQDRHGQRTSAHTSAWKTRVSRERPAEPREA